MVGVGSNAKKSVLARCCLVDWEGEKIYDEFVRPKSYVTDFRTKYSGVRKCDLRRGNAVPLEEVSGWMGGWTVTFFLFSLFCQTVC
jgi:hypothetical protein